MRRIRETENTMILRELHLRVPQQDSRTFQKIRGKDGKLLVGRFSNIISEQVHLTDMDVYLSILKLEIQSSVYEDEGHCDWEFMQSSLA